MGLWVPDIRFTSCDLRILVDQPTEPISADDPPSRCQGSWFVGLKWRCLPQCAVRAVAVVVVGVLGQHRPQLPTAKDQHPVQDLPPNRADPPLRVGVGPRRPYRRAQHLDPLGGEDRVERGGELRIPVPDQEPELADAVLQAHEQAAGMLRHHAAAGWAVTPSTWTRWLATSIANNTYSRRSNTVSTVKKV